MLRAALVGFVLPAALAGCGVTTDDDGESGDTTGGGADALCEVRYAWEPGTGDLGSFPTVEMYVEDATRPSGYRVEITADEFPGVADYLAYESIFTVALSSLDGFGLIGDAFMGFDGALDGASLPGGTAVASASDSIGMAALGTDGSSELVPVSVELTDGGQTLMVYPMVPLEPGSRAVIYVRGDAPTPDGGCVGASDGMRDLLDAAEGEVGEALDALIELGVAAHADDLAALQVYPVQSARRESLAIAEHIAGLDNANWTLGGQTCEASVTWKHCYGTLTSSDYRNGDGVVTVDVDAVAEQASWDLVVHTYLPTGAGQTGPFPTILYGHGLTGAGEDASSFATQVAPDGMAVVAISALMHDDHPSLMGQTFGGLQATLAFFAADINAGNIDPLRLRDHFRQSTYDKLHVTRFLQTNPDLDNDDVPDIDSDRMAYLGISLGAVMGTELLALTDAYDGGVLVMPGGRVTTVMTDPNGSFDDVLGVLVPTSFTAGDTRRLFGILQGILDPGDPASYGGILLHDRASFAPQVPDVLTAVVLDDGTVVNPASWALTRAIGHDIVPPVLREVPGMGVTAAAPLTGNLDGGSATAGVLQFDVINPGVAATHTNTSYSDVGLMAWTSFLNSLFTDGTATIIDPYEAIGLAHEVG